MNVKPRELLHALAVAAVIGIPVSLAALGFLAAAHELEHLLWETLPHDGDFTSSTWWWLLLVPPVTAFASALTLGEALHPASLAGMLVALAGVGAVLQRARGTRGATRSLNLSLRRA